MGPTRQCGRAAVVDEAEPWDRGGKGKQTPDLAGWSGARHKADYVGMVWKPHQMAIYGHR